MEFLILWLLLTLSTTSLGLQVDCFSEGRSTIICRCFGSFGDTQGYEDLGQIVDTFFQENRFTNAYIQNVKLRDCGNLDIIIDLRRFIVDLRPQNISLVSFEDIARLRVDFRDIDYGFKQFVFKSVGYLTITGRMEHESTQVSFYIHNNIYERGEVNFENFEADSYINVMNIQDASSLRIRNSEFYNTDEVEILRTDACYYDGDPVTCDGDYLFSASYSLFGRYFYRSPAFIVLMVLLIICIIIAILACFYVRKWRKKKDLEFLGYPASTISRSPPGSSARFNSPRQYDVKPERRRLEEVSPEQLDVKTLRGFKAASGR